jgi:hypothetical protein
VIYTAAVGLMNMRCRIDHVESAGEPDEYGNPTNVVTTASWSRCYLAQNSRTELGDGVIDRDRWALGLPPGVLVDSNDTVTVDGVAYEVRGDPWKVIEPVTGRVSHIEATLQRTQ